MERNNAISGDGATFDDLVNDVESMASTNVASSLVGYVGNILNEGEALTYWETLDDADVPVWPDTIK